MTTILGEAEAWREIAVRHATRATYPLGFPDLRSAGLCVGVANLKREGVIGHETADAMHDRIIRHGWAWSGCGHLGYWPREDWGIRVLAALFLALECEDEAKAAKRRAA